MKKLLFLAILAVSSHAFSMVDIHGKKQLGSELAGAQLPQQWEMNVSDVAEHEITLVPLLRGKKLRVSCSRDGKLSADTENRLGFFKAEVNGMEVSCQVFIEDK